jgi:D-arginine dehydrogenase
VRVLVVGGGIAGAGVAAALAGRADVTLIEQETTLAFHTTGRSAALFFESYGAPPIRPLSRASRSFLESPPPGSVDHPLLSPRGALLVGSEEDRAALDVELEDGLGGGSRVQRIDGRGAREICPVLRPEAVTDAVWEPDAADIDVAGLHQAFVRLLRRGGGDIVVGAELRSGDRRADGWRVELADRDGAISQWEGDVVVDAAGAWADVVATRCGVPPVGLQPMRRTAFMVAGSPQSSRWPLVAEVGHRWYFKPDGEQILCSLADETPADPGDARPEELDVALAIDRINDATTLGIRHVRSSWAGLRTFAPDRSMVIGPDPAEPTFVWLAGQGGTGIQTAAAAGELAAALALDEALPDELVAAGCEVAPLSPHRLRPEP